MAKLKVLIKFDWSVSAKIHLTTLRKYTKRLLFPSIFNFCSQDSDVLSLAYFKNILNNCGVVDIKVSGSSF